MHDYFDAEEFELLEKPLRDIDSTIEKFVREHNYLIIGEPNYHNWPSRTLEIRRRNYNDIFRHIYVGLEFETDTTARIPTKEKTYMIYASAYYDLYGITKTIKKGMPSNLLKPELIYRLLEEAYGVATGFKKEDLKKSL